MMSPAEARDRFSDAFEDALEGDERAAFERALDADRALAEDYRAFCEALAQTRALGRTVAPRPSVDLLEGAKARIRRRMRGRFHRDAFAPSRATGRVLPLVVAVLLLLLLGITYAGIHYMDALRGAAPPTEAPAELPPNTR
jgi:anti-sigma-K factor RskA